MDYKISDVVERLGNGIKIEAGTKSYEQFICKDGLVARVCSDSNITYNGVIYRKPFLGSPKDHEQFEVFAKRLQDISGEETPHSEQSFMNYISCRGLEQEHKIIRATIRINLKDKKPLPVSSQEFLNSRAHWAGAVADAFAYSAGAVLLNQLGSEYKTRENFMVYFGLPSLEIVLGFLFQEIYDSPWIGPIHAIGFLPVKRALTKKLRSPNYMIGRFQKANERFKESGIYSSLIPPQLAVGIKALSIKS
jgi:hypothetical protein